MKICLLLTVLKNNNGVFTCLSNIKKVLSDNQINADIIAIGKEDKKMKSIKFFNKNNKNLYNILNSYDLIHIVTLNNNYSKFEFLLNTLIKLSKKSKILITIHDTKSVASKSGKGLLNFFIPLINNGSYVLFYGKEEQKFCVSKFNIKKSKQLNHIYFLKNNKTINKKKNKIVVTSRIDFCKGIGFIKNYILNRKNKYPIEFWSKYVNRALAYFTKLDFILNDKKIYKGGFSSTKKDYKCIYNNARILFNFTWWGKGSGGRTEYTILEAWDYGVVPFVDERWVNVENSLLIHGYNCIAIKRNNVSQLDYMVNKVFTNQEFYKRLVKGGKETLNRTINKNTDIIELYKSILKKDFKSDKLSIFKQKILV